MSNPTPPAAPETLTALVARWRRLAAARPNPPGELSDALAVYWHEWHAEELRALAATHDAEMARLRQERDEVALLATVGCNTGPSALEACKRIIAITADRPAALTRTQAEAKLRAGKDGYVVLRFEHAIKRILDTLFGPLDTAPSKAVD